MMTEPRTGSRGQPLCDGCRRCQLGYHCRECEELRALPVTVDLVTAGRAHGLGRTISYELERAGEFPCPVHRRGRYYRVLKAELMTSLGLGMDGEPLSPSPSSPAGDHGERAA